MITREKLHKHFYHIVKNSKGLDSDIIVKYIDNLSEKIHIPFEDVMTEFVDFWKISIKER